MQRDIFVVWVPLPGLDRMVLMANRDCVVVAGQSEQNVAIVDLLRLTHNGSVAKDACFRVLMPLV